MVGTAGAHNAQLGVQALSGLLLADAPALCSAAQARDPRELFVPIYAGEAPDKAVAVELVNADDLEQVRFNRVCDAAHAESICPASTAPSP